jgi:CHASE2 domain-containing sensor protein
VNEWMKADQTFRLWLWGFLALAVLAFPLPAFSQGCALCYTQAASSGAKMIVALKSGILILVIPPTLASIGMVFLVHRKRNQIRRDESGVESGQPW